MMKKLELERRIKFVYYSFSFYMSIFLLWIGLMILIFGKTLMQISLITLESYWLIWGIFFFSFSVFLITTAIGWSAKSWYNTLEHTKLKRYLIRGWKWTS